MKKIFTNSQVAHVWASESQSEGRNSGGSIYFEGRRIYSYGRHYLLGEIHHIKGRRVFAINVRGYSPTTSKHIWDAINAVPESDITFRCKDPSNLKRSLAIRHAEIAEEYYNYFSDRKAGWSEWKDRWNGFEDKVDEFNLLCDLFDAPSLKIELTELHEELWREKYYSLKEADQIRNSPEAIAKRDAARAKAEANRKAKLEAELATDLLAWKSGGPRTSRLSQLEPQQIRIKEDRVETTGGADVPLADAIKLLKRIQNKKAKSGDRVGSFEFKYVERDEIKGHVAVIGCHRISMQEAIQLLTSAPQLKLIQGGAR